MGGHGAAPAGAAAGPVVAGPSVPGSSPAGPVPVTWCRAADDHLAGWAPGHEMTGRLRGCCDHIDERHGHRRPPGRRDGDRATTTAVTAPAEPAHAHDSGDRT